MFVFLVSEKTGQDHPILWSLYMKKIRVGVVFGGKSAEHEVSLQSAKNIINAIDKKKFDVSLIEVDKNGNWKLCNSTNHIENDTNIHLMLSHKSGENIAILPGESENHMIEFKSIEKLPKIDVIFPIIHGTHGEDGTLQGMLKLANIPFVGSDVLGSAICMDKDISKKLLISAGLEVAPYVSVYQHMRSEISFFDVKSILGMPVFIKPANQGSSVGISKVFTENEYNNALDLAFMYSEKVLIEQAIHGKEIECAILGNYRPKASICGEIEVKGPFYSYEIKYLEPETAKIYIPARISEQDSNNIREVALKSFKALECSGMARVDVFLTKESRIIINEINTLPGFTNISMFPKLWESSGIDYSELISILIELALERHVNLGKMSKLIQ